MRGRGCGLYSLCLGTTFLCCYAHEYKLKPIDPEKFRYTFRDGLADFARVNFNVFSKETILVGSIFAPLYALAVQIDDRVHRSLYNETEHRNLFGDARWVRPFLGDVSVVVPLLGISAGFLCSDDANTKVTGSVLLSGMISVGAIRTCIKSAITHPVSYRPYSGMFPKKTVCGGFPSGHAATLMFATTLLGLRKGIKWAFPMGVYSGLVCGLLISCNWHYASQLIAGMGLGTIFAVAAHETVKMRLKDWDAGLSVTPQGSLGFGVSYSF